MRGQHRLSAAERVPDDTQQSVEDGEKRRIHVGGWRNICVGWKQKVMVDPHLLESQMSFSTCEILYEEQAIPTLTYHSNFSHSRLHRSEAIWYDSSAQHILGVSLFTDADNKSWFMELGLLGI